MELVIAILSFIAAIILNIFIDGKIWRNQRDKPTNTRNHKNGWYLKAATCLPAAYFFFQASSFRLIPNLVVTSALLCCWFMCLFDGFYNIYRKEPFFFTGTEDGKDDAKTDNFWAGMHPALHISLKLILSFVTAYLYNLGLQK